MGDYIGTIIYLAPLMTKWSDQGGITLAVGRREIPWVEERTCGVLGGFFVVP